MAASELAPVCGDCVNFSTIDAEGQSFGLKTSGPTAGEAIGLCRAPYGLLVGERTESSTCPRVKQEFFQAKDAGQDLVAIYSGPNTDIGQPFINAQPAQFE